MNAFAAPATMRASGFRELRVVAKKRESSTIPPFHPEPADAEGWRDFRPGQFLVFRNAAHGGLNVVYRRVDGNVGWIDPSALATASA